MDEEIQFIKEVKKYGDPEVTFIHEVWVNEKVFIHKAGKRLPIDQEPGESTIVLKVKDPKILYQILNIPYL